MVGAKWRLLMSSRTFVCLVPLLVFNGLEQGFVYAIYNKVDTDTVALHFHISGIVRKGGGDSVAEWLACWTQAQ